MTITSFIQLFPEFSVQQVLCGALSAMAAVGITSNGDWLSVLILCIQLAGILVVIFAISQYRWFYVALLTVRRDIK